MFLYGIEFFLYHPHPIFQSIFFFFSPIDITCGKCCRRYNKRKVWVYEIETIEIILYLKRSKISFLEGCDNHSIQIFLLNAEEWNNS